MANEPDKFDDEEAQARVDAALKGALSTPPKPLRDKPKMKKADEKAKEK
jgi:hypothetical protein